MNTYKVDDLVKRFGVQKYTIYRWIRDGYLHPTRVGSGRGNYYKFSQEDVEAFARSANFRGNPQDIIPEMFNRVPNVEECFPINLLASVLTIRLDNEEVAYDIWDYDIRQFRKLITLLPDREQKILDLRYRFGMTLDEVGTAFYLSKERIRLIQAKAERKLRYWCANLGCRVVSRDEHRELLRKCHMLEDELEALKKQINDRNTDEPKDSLNYITIEELGLSVRTYNCLKRANLNTAGDLIYFDDQQGNEDSPFIYKSWWNIRNMGKKSRIELAKVMFEKFGYRLHDWKSNTDCSDLIPLCLQEENVPGGVDYAR